MSHLTRGNLHLRHLPLAVSVTAVTLLIALLAVPSGSAAPGPRPPGDQIRVMTRNVYLGADLTDATNAPTTTEFVKANGAILRSVDATNFPKRSKALAAEIIAKNPDLVGLQEVALWREAPGSTDPVFNGPSATKVRYDFLELLTDQLNKGKKRYRVVVVQEEFDFEAPADENQKPNDGPALAPDGEINGRLTMRDVILARIGAGVKVKNAKGGQYETQFQVIVGGAVPVTVERGFVRADVRIRGSRQFRFVNTHFEAFGDPKIREAQAKELIGKGGAANSRLPVILVGDLNSDDNTVRGADRKAYLAIKRKGFKDLATEKPMSCCITDPLLKGGKISDFDHHIDHILTDTPRQITKVNSSVTGRKRVGGLWPSDHAGVFSTLLIR